MQTFGAPLNSKPWLDVGSTQSRAGAWEEADALKNGILLAREREGLSCALALRGRVSNRLGKFDEALGDCQRAWDLEPENNGRFNDSGRSLATAQLFARQRQQLLGGAGVAHLVRKGCGAHRSWS